MDEVEVEIGEVVDGIEGFWRLRAAEARMGRDNHPSACGEPLQHGSIGLDADPGMKEEQRPTLSALDQLNADAIDADCLCHRSSARAFSGKVDAGFPQKMRPTQEARARFRFHKIETRSNPLVAPLSFCHRPVRDAPTIVAEELCRQLS